MSVRVGWEVSGGLSRALLWESKMHTFRNEVLSVRLPIALQARSFRKSEICYENIALQGIKDIHIFIVAFRLSTTKAKSAN